VAFHLELAEAEAAVVPDASGNYDIILVAVRRDQLASACAGLTDLAGEPAVLFLGNNPAGRAAIAGGLPGDVYLGFPGAGGVLTGGTAEYVRIRQQPTALPETSDPRLAALESDLTGRGFAVQRVADMDGWLAYHSISAMWRQREAVLPGWRSALPRPAPSEPCVRVVPAHDSGKSVGVAG
jgi:ketopantoate reductase